MVERLIERYRYEISRLYVALSVDNRVTERELHVLTGHEGKHIRRHELIGRTVVEFGLSLLVGLGVVTGGVKHVRDEPCVEIVELEPSAGRQLKRQHRHSRTMGREDIRAMLRITPLDTFALYADTTPPGIQGYTTS